MRWPSNCKNRTQHAGRQRQQTYYVRFYALCWWPPESQQPLGFQFCKVFHKGTIDCIAIAINSFVEKMRPIMVAFWFHICKLRIKFIISGQFGTQQLCTGIPHKSSHVRKKPWHRARATKKTASLPPLGWTYYITKWVKKQWYSAMRWLLQQCFRLPSQCRFHLWNDQQLFWMNVPHRR